MLSVKTNMMFLEGGPRILVPLKLIGNGCVSPKVCFFGWEAWWGKILTMGQMKKRWFFHGQQMFVEWDYCVGLQKTLTTFWSTALW